MTPRRLVIAVAGESLVDLVPGPEHGYWRALPGGSPANTAVALARLGAPVAYLGRLSRDAFGRDIRAHLTASGVVVDHVVEAPEPSTLAVVSRDEGGAASYGFYLTGTSDFAWRPGETPRLPSGCVAVHVGSLAAVLDPAARVVADLVRSVAETAVRSFDPNVRPGAGVARDEYRSRVERLVADSDLVRASADDLAWLYPGVTPLDAARGWVGGGRRLVVVTYGGDGATGVTADSVVRVPAPAVAVVDTVGAGDAFTAGLLVALAERGRLDRRLLAGLDAGELAACLAFAARVAAVTCGRDGADPPWRREIEREDAGG